LLGRGKAAWLERGSAGGGGALALPEPPPTVARLHLDVFWVPLETESELHGLLGLTGVADSDHEDLAAFCGPVFGGLLAAHRLSRLMKEADFGLKARLLELESVFCLRLSLGGHLAPGTL